MGTTLTGTTPQDTYDSLIKVTDNGPIGATAKYLSDGLGNDSKLALSTGNVGINITAPKNQLHVNGQLQVGFVDASNDAMVFSWNGASTYGAIQTFSSSALALNPLGNNVGIGTSSPATKLDVLGTTFLRDNLNAGKTANINVTTAVNGTGGGNREFTTFTGASATGFTGTDATDQGFGYFAATIVSGRSYEVSATMVVTNGNPLSFITSTGRNFATDTVQTVQSSPVSNTTYRFVATGNASFFGISASNTGGGMTCVVSNFLLKEVGSVLVTSDSNVGVGTTSPAVPLDVVGNIRSSTGILFGSDTAAANALDDYEEGTFTPTIIGSTTAGTATYSEQNGRYTKIGRLVQFEIYMVYTAGTGTGNLRISNLPFTIGGLTYASFSIGAFDNIAMTALNFPLCFGLVGSSQIYLGEMPVGGGSVQAVAYDSAGGIQIAGTYSV